MTQNSTVCCTPKTKHGEALQAAGLKYERTTEAVCGTGGIFETHVA